MSSASSNSVKYCHQQDSDDDKIGWGSDIPQIGSLSYSGSDITNLNAISTKSSQLPPLRPVPISLTEELCTPETFEKCFPSLDILSIGRDRSAPYENMDLRVDGRMDEDQCKFVQLFQMHIYNLAEREFSLHRYHRNSGSILCSGKRKYAKERDFPVCSKAIADITTKVEGHATSPQEDGTREAKAQPLRPTNIIRLEFDNYV
jgi:hypothetical protein